MEINKKFLQKYLHSIAIEQLADEYNQNGYAVTKEERIGKYEADIIARKGNEAIVIEVKSGKMTPDRKKAIAGIADYVKDKGDYKFLLVVATPPKEKKLEIIDLEQLLNTYMLDHFPDELSELSSHTRIEDISDVEIDEISINKNETYVAGSGIVEVELQYGSDSDQGTGDGYIHHNKFPFEFDLTLEYNNSKKKLEISHVDKLEVDNSSFYS